MIANPFRMAMLAAPVLAALAYGARADIFTWVDESGTVNFTNEAPPEGVQARTVARDNPAPPVVAAEQREAQSKAEVRALSDRIHRLEADAAAASASAPSAPPPFVSPLPVPGYAVAPSPPERLSYAFSGPSVESACSPPWLCDYSRGSPFYPTYVYVLAPFRVQGFHRSREFRAFHGDSLFSRAGLERGVSEHRRK